MRTLLAINKTGKISAAARALGLTSPAVTLQLQQLERELDSQLFLRTRSGARATDSGEIVIDLARKVLTEIDLFEERLNARKGIQAGTLRLGVVSTGKYFSPRIIAAFNKEYPGITITLFAANRSQIIRQLQEHDVDIALMGRPPSHFDVRATLFGDHPLVFIAHPDHPLCAKRDIDKEELAKHKFIVREKGSGTRSSFKFFMSDARGSTGLTATEMDSNETIKQAVMAGLGLAFISGHTIEQETQSGSLVVLDVKDTPIRRQWYSVRNASRSATPAMLALEDFLRNQGPSLLPVISKIYPLSSY